MLFNIEPLRMWVHKVLPVVYDDSLSYYEVLAKTVRKLNEVIDLTDEQTKFIQEFSDNLTKAINEWEEGLSTEWTNYKKRIDAEWENYKSNTDEDIEIWKHLKEVEIERAVAEGIYAFAEHFEEVKNQAEDAADRAGDEADRAEAAADEAAENAVEAVMPTLQGIFDNRYAFKSAIGSPLVASTAAEMTDTNKIYVYVGDETGYVSGNWYYYDGTAWTSGGVYNSVAVVTDTTLTQSGVPADAKVTGDDITDLKSALNAQSDEIIAIQKSDSVEINTSGNQILIGATTVSADITTQTLLDILHTGKNILKYPYQASSLTANGITFTVNSDGTITASGTATANAIIQLVNESNRRSIKSGTYTISGVDATSNADGNTNRIALGITGVTEKYEYGTGVTFTIQNDTTFYLKWVIFSGATVNTTLRPQIEIGSVATEYEKYTEETISVNGTKNVDLYPGINVFSASSDFSVTSYVQKNKSKIFNLADYTVGDGIVDDTQGINNALIAATGGTLLIPVGVYLFSGTLNIHSGTRVIGCGNASVFKLANTYSLTPYTWRNDAGGYYQNRYPMIATDAESQGCILENFAVVGQTVAFKDENEDCVCIRGGQHIVRNLHISKINYFPDAFSERTCITPAWGITVINADTIIVENCYVDECGYECFGVEESENVTIDSCKSGVGNQTSMQIHRNVHQCRITNCTMLKSSSCMTMDANPDTPMSEILIDSNYIQGVLNFVAGGENAIRVTNNHIGAGVNCNNQSYRSNLILSGNNISGRVGTWHDNAIITDNIINVSTGYYMIIHNGNKSVISNNLGVGSVTDVANNTHS